LAVSRPESGQELESMRGEFRTSDQCWSQKKHHVICGCLKLAKASCLKHECVQFEWDESLHTFQNKLSEQFYVSYDATFIRAEDLGSYA
jgi:hypothetical protein